jgi:flavin reductase (DIM6/NTAB) family NADH-FMN oxidoreductase RutF
MNRVDAVTLASPFPYALVVTVDEHGKPNIMGASWWTFTSARPWMVAVAIGHSRYTHQCLEYCREFVLCFPSEEQAEAAWLCGTKSGRTTDKFDRGGFIALNAKFVKPPIIQGSTVALECKVINQLECGDHTLYNGEVLASYGNPDRSRHLYTIHYRKLLSIDHAGTLNMDLGL